MPGPGHAYPMLAVARALASRGHEVVFASSGEHAAEAARAGCASEALPLTEGSPVDALRPYLDSENLARAFAPAVARHAPDVMVVDLLTLGAALAAEMNGVPFASLVIHGLHLPSRDLMPFGYGADAGGRLGRWRARAMRRAAMKDLARARASLNASRGRLGLGPVDGVDGTLSPDLVLVATLPSLEPPRSDWPANAHVIGPCLWEAAGPAPADPPGDGPLVLVAASTAWSDERLVEAAIEACRSSGARAIVTAGKTEWAGDDDPAVTVVPFASHDAVLARADAVICNGGHGIVARSLSYGVPVVVLPGHGDQRENGYRVERAGAGVRVLKPSGLPRALRSVLATPSFRAAAGAIAREANGMNGPETAADLVLRLAERAGAAPGHGTQAR